jgi:hypothetical protein
MDASTLIERLDGTSAVARICGLAPSTVSGWKHSGIPKGWLAFFRSSRPDLFALPAADPVSTESRPAPA